MPDMPTWGRSEDPLAFYSANDFEILGICFRAEVENYIATLDQYFDFIANEPRPPDRETQTYYDEHYRGILNVQVADVENAPLSQIFTARARAFDKSSFPPLRFREDLPPIQFERGSAHHQIDDPKAHIYGRQRRSTPFRFSTLGFRIPNNSYRPSGSNHHIGSDDESNADRKRKGKEEKPDSGKAGKLPAQTGGNPDDDPSSSDEDNRRGPARRIPSSGRRATRNSHGSSDDSSEDDGTNGRYFDLRLKDSDIPKWDGNTDTLIRWIQQVNLVAEDGPKARKQLGRIAPRAFTGTAQDWYFALPVEYQHEIRQSWDTMRQALADFFLSSKWLDKTRSKALRATYRQAGHGREKPSEYFIRKHELLTSVYAFEDSAIISEVINGAPRSWCTILDTQNYQTVLDFHAAIIFHEDTLLDLPMNRLEDHE
ncbi:hypothetical protein C8J57DRAFT_1517855 [Mycena rebaudengoi]|nr:hypothetical protein C8J57DRAFT_1517855 [Mycena rebaudengoi]